MNELGDALGTNIIDSTTLKIIQDRVEYLMKNPPNLVCVNVILNDSSALEYSVVKDIIMNAANITEEQAAWYLIMAGVQSELRKLALVGVKLKDDTKN
jgi:hypothetical protein